MSLTIPFNPEFANPSSRSHQALIDFVSNPIRKVLSTKDIPGKYEANVKGVKRNNDGNTDIDLRISFADGTNVDSALRENVKSKIQEALNNNELSSILGDRSKPVTLLKKG